MLQQEAHHKVGLGETPRRLIRKLWQYSSGEKFEDALDAAVHYFCRISHDFWVISLFLHYGESGVAFRPTPEHGNQNKVEFGKPTHGLLLVVNTNCCRISHRFRVIPKPFSTFSTFRTRFAHFSVILNSVLQPIGRSWWYHFRQICGAACPR